MAEKLRVMLVNNYAGRGGIPRAVAALANGLASRGHDLVVLSQKPVPKFLHPLYMLAHKINVLSLPPDKRAPLPKGADWIADIFPLHPAVRVEVFCFSDNNLKIQALRKRIIKINPGVCVCPLADGAHLVWAVTLLGSGIPYVYSERTSPDAMENVFWRRKGRLAAMSGADAIHLLLPEYIESVPPFLRDRVTVIPNAVNVPSRMADACGSERKIFLWLGRLYEEAKQCRLALEAFALIAARFSDWDFHVAGDGPDRRAVMAFAASLSLGKRIKFLDESASPEILLASAQAFCFSSKFEGMSNALLEAMAAGLPCVAFSGCAGVSSIICDGATGLLAKNMTASELAAQMARLMADPSLRRRLGKAARKSMSAFSSRAVMDAWEKLLYEAAAQKGSTALDSIRAEPFASMARLSARSRQEWVLRDFGQPMPDSIERKILAIPGILKKSAHNLAKKLSWKEP